MELDVLIIAKPYEAQLMRGALAGSGHRPVVWDGRDDPSLLIEREPPAVIVLSLRLQQADGAVVLGQIRTGAQGARVPVVLIGDVSSPVATLADAVRLGANQLLLRPLESDLLAAKVEAVAGQGPPLKPPRDAAEIPAALGDERSTAAADQAVDAVSESSGFHDDLELELRYELDAVERRLFPQDDQRGSVFGDQLVHEGAASGILEGRGVAGPAGEAAGNGEGEGPGGVQVAGAPDVVSGGHGEEQEDRPLHVDRERIRAKHAQVCEGDYFALLGLGTDASAQQVKRAYQRLRQAFAAEALSAELVGEFSRELAEIVEVIEEAYQVLHDDETRQAYRNTL